MSVTREEWLAARERLDAVAPPRPRRPSEYLGEQRYLDELVEAVLGPFPLEGRPSAKEQLEAAR
jgi:hypothetical protein